MATKISEVIESLLEIQKIHGDVAVYAPRVEEDHNGMPWSRWAEAEAKEGKYGQAICVKIEGLS